MASEGAFFIPGVLPGSPRSWVSGLRSQGMQGSDLWAEREEVEGTTYEVKRDTDIRFFESEEGRDGPNGPAIGRRGRSRPTLKTASQLTQSTDGEEDRIRTFVLTSVRELTDPASTSRVY
jgi:hypothetical protein